MNDRSMQSASVSAAARDSAGGVDRLRLGSRRSPRTSSLACVLSTCLLGCGGAQSTQSEPPPESPAYTTSSGSASASTPTTAGHQHGAPGPGQHVMPDGAVMEGHQHGGATHVMPDGTIMPGAQHGKAP
jgi:hypothetical protein